MTKVLALDTETTGVDFHHGAAPFFVTACDGDGAQTWWEFDVDPLTRKPAYVEADLWDIRDKIEDADLLVLHNPKFDYQALRAASPKLVETWDWGKVRDTLLASHLLDSLRPHDLTYLAAKYLKANISPAEDKLKEACKSIRTKLRTTYKEWGWATAKAGRPDMPSASAECWKMDMWLPRAFALKMWDESSVKAFADKYGPEAGHKAASEEGWEFRPPGGNWRGDHPYYTLLADYANTDTAVTACLWEAMEARLRERGLWRIYRERLKILPIAVDMETRGVTVSGKNLREKAGEYRGESARAGRVCVNLANGLGHELELPKGASPNNSLRKFIYEGLNLPPLRGGKKAKSDLPTLGRAAMEAYLYSSPERSKAKHFVKTLLGKRSRDTALAYMKGYEKFWLPYFDPSTGSLVEPTEEFDDWFVLYPNLNPTGTRTLRWSSSNPNEQNISKREEFNLRYCFGPAPGREWWSLDAKNIELRLPAYESGEAAFITLFERPDDPPYFGSNHLLIAHVLHPKEFEACVNPDGAFVDGRIFKKKYAATLYQRTKNGNFAVQYGAVDREDGLGTADLTYGIPGAQARIMSRFDKQAALNDRCIRFADRYGYVETMPDRNVDPKRGYPLVCPRTDYGRVKPTVPLNYHVQGTAMWWMMKAKIRVFAKLEEWRKEGFDSRIVMQVHDELVLDFPKSKRHPAEKVDRSNVFRRAGDNLWRVRVIQKLMERGGDDLGVPTPVSCEYHEHNWSEGVSL